MCQLPGLGGFPKGEIARVVLLVFILVDARAGLDALGLQLRKLAVAGKARDAKVNRALALVGVAVVSQALDQRDHVVDVLGGLGDALGFFEPQRGAVVKEGFRVLGREVLERKAGGPGVADDLVLDVGHVHDVHQRIPAMAQIAAQNVLEGERPQIADVHEVVDRRPAGVHANRVPLGGGKGFELVGERVEELERHVVRNRSRRLLGGKLLF